jgi:hypothetical protein
MPNNVATLSLRNYEIILMGPWNMVPDTARFVGLDLLDTSDFLQLSSVVSSPDLPDKHAEIHAFFIQQPRWAHDCKPLQPDLHFIFLISVTDAVTLHRHAYTSHAW